MSQSTKNRIVPAGYISLSFILPLFLLLLLYGLNQFYPFNQEGFTPLMIDAQSQYISYLRYFKAVLEGDESLIYTFSKTFGGDFLSIYTYYLASPFNLVLPLVKNEMIPTFMMFTNILKMSFAGLNFYLLCRVLKKRDCLGYMIFSTGYALISYSFIYESNFMWLDGAMIFPLIILGLLLSEERRTLWLYPLALAYSLLCTWYIGSISILFICFFFIYRYAIHPESFKERNYFLLRFVIFSLIGGFLAAPNWLVAFSHLPGTKASASLPNNVFMTLSSLISGFLENGYSEVSKIQQNFGFCSAFVGSVPLIFFFTFFGNAHYSKKERIATAILFSAFLLIASSSLVDAIFHGGRQPTWFPARYSFIYGFFICYFGFLSFEKFKDIRAFGYLYALLIPIAAIVVLMTIPVKENQYYDISVPSAAIYFISLFVLFILNLILRATKQEKAIAVTLSFVLLPVSLYSSYRGGENIIKQNIEQKQYETQETYLDDCSYDEDFEKLKSLSTNNDSRMVTTLVRKGTYNQIDNNPMFYGFSGLSHFSSSERNEVKSHMLKLGFHDNNYFEKYDSGSTLAMNAYLGVKYYLIDKNGTFPAFIGKEDVKQITSLTPKRENVEFYENNLALPLGFEVSPSTAYYVSEGTEIGYESTHWYDHFEYQNEIYKSITSEVVEDGEKKDIFTPLEIQKIEVPGDLRYHKEKADNGIRIDHMEKNESITYHFTLGSERERDHFYFCTKDLNAAFSYYLDGKHIDGISTYWHKGIQPIRNTRRNDHTLKLTAKRTLSDEPLRVELYRENTEVLRSYIDKIKEGSLREVEEVKSISSYGLKGKFDLKNTKDEFLFTLPCERGISIYIDGKKREVEKRFNIFTAVSLEGLEEGEHRIEILYTDSIFVLSLLVGSFALALFIPMCYKYLAFEDKLRNKKRKSKDIK